MLGGIGWSAVYLAILAVLCLFIGLVLFLTSQRRIWVKTVVTLAGICVLLVALVVMAMGYTDAGQQIDRYTVSGSDGGPLCPASG
ncbi:hypothetical protein A5740_21600 [Mycobacterium sp. GA-1841]|nr:hypothetical protein A5740_21600 [Mycobacterium sp. GA-1841]